MKRLIIIAIAAISLASCNIPWVHVKDNRLIGPDGKELILRGLCFPDPVKLIREHQWNERYFDEAAAWGANVVRFAVHPSNLRQMGWERTFQEMDKGIQWAKERGMYVIMDWHSIGNLVTEKFTSPMYNTTKQETFRFWRTVAQRYKDEPAVAFYELFNEPTVTAQGTEGTTWTQWKQLQEQIIDTIRTYNPKAVCLCAGFNWAYELTPIKSEPIERENIAYVSHPYPQKCEQPWADKWERDFGFASDKYPVICTEMGFCLADEPGAHVPVKSTGIYGKEITEYFERKGISFTVWCFDTSWAPMLISDWNFTPTTQGRFFRQYLQENSKRKP